MTNSLREGLARRARAVEPPAFDVHALVSVGEKRLRRRRFGAVAGSVLAVALAVGVPAVVWDLGEEPRSVEQPKPPGPPRKVEEPGTRPIAYGQGQTLHLGNREIDTGLDFLSVAVTDDGAALTTIDGGIWFADGRTVERIGSTIALRVRPRSVSGPAGMPRDWVITDTAGSLLAWLEYPGQRPDRPELVVYDSARRVVLDRRPIEVPDGGSATVLAIAGRAVFLGEGPRRRPRSLAPCTGTTWTPECSNPSTWPSSRPHAAESAAPWSSAPRPRPAGCSTRKDSSLTWASRSAGSQTLAPTRSAGSR